MTTDDVVIEPPANQPSAEARGAEAREAGRGGLAIAVAKVSFVLFGFVQQLVLPRLLDQAGYGAVSRMLAIVSILNNVMVATSIQGVSRMVAAVSPDRQETTIRATLRIHVVIALVASTTFAALAGVIANAVESPSASGPLRIGAGVVLCYGVYAPLVGSLNGRRRFMAQAGLDIFYGMSRTVTLLGAAWAFSRFLGGNGAMGAAVGFVTAAALIIPIAMTRSGIGRKGAGGPDAREYLQFLLPVFAAQAGLNLLLQCDLLLLSNAAGKYARLMSLDEKEADKLLAPYRAAQLFAFLPYQQLMSVQFVLFPMLAKASGERDFESVKRFTRGGVRTALVLTGLIASPCAALAPFLLRFAFPQAIAEGAAPFARLYVLGFSSLAILGVASSALASLRREGLSMALSWIAVAMVAGTVLLTRTSDAFGPALLKSTAYAAAGAMTAGAAVGGVFLWRASGAFVKPLSFIRVVAATGITVAAGSFMPWAGKLIVPIEAGVVAVVYVVLLIAFGELGKSDLALVKNVLARRKKA